MQYYLLARDFLRGTVQCLLLIYSVQFSIVSHADWKASGTNENASFSIAINVVDKGVRVTSNFTEKALKKLQDNAEQAPLLQGISDRQKLINIYVQHVLEIHGEDDQKLLIGEDMEADSNPATNMQNAAKTGLIEETFFPYVAQQPKQLLIKPLFDLIKIAGNDFLLTVAHNGLPVIDHGVLKGPEVLLLDWEDPWFSYFKNPDLKRDHNDPVVAFLYVEPRLLKCEIVVRIKELADWMQLGLRDKKIIFPDEYALLKQRVGEFLLKNNTLQADHKVLQPTLERIDYIKVGAADIQAYEPNQSQQQATTLIGVSLTYPMQDFPQTVRWTWELYSEKIKSVTIRAYDPIGIFDSYVTPENKVFEWENQFADIELPGLQSVHVVENQEPWHISDYWPAIAGLLLLMIVFFVLRSFPNSNRNRIYKQINSVLVITIASFLVFQNRHALFQNQVAHLDAVKQQEVIQKLLWNVYQAFEAKQEEKVYDQLALSVSGNLHETLYLQNREALLLNDGAWSKINSVEIRRLTGNPLPGVSESYLYDCEWSVIGEVIHWGHQHRRENLYRAAIKIAPIEGSWKIIELQSLAQQRV